MKRSWREQKCASTEGYCDEASKQWRILKENGNKFGRMMGRGPSQK